MRWIMHMLNWLDMLIPLTHLAFASMAALRIHWPFLLQSYRFTRKNDALGVNGISMWLNLNSPGVCRN